jgi:hypothetical protein
LESFISVSCLVLLSQTLWKSVVNTANNMKLVLITVEQCTLNVRMLYLVNAVACESVSLSVVKRDIKKSFFLNHYWCSLMLAVVNFSPFLGIK